MNKTSTEMQKDGDRTVGGESSGGLLMGPQELGTAGILWIDFKAKIWERSKF